MVATFLRRNARRNRSKQTSPDRHSNRFFTLGSGIDHMESRSMSGVSLDQKSIFSRRTDANADVTQISNLAMAI